MNYAELENKVSGIEGTSFVVRDTSHPVEDLIRNWSSTVGGVNYEGRFGFSSEEEAKETDPSNDYRYHPAHEAYCIVDYEGLGAFSLDSETVCEAVVEADEYSKRNDLAECLDSGDGHFYAEDVVSFHKVREGRYIFEVK